MLHVKTLARPPRPHHGIRPTAAAHRSRARLTTGTDTPCAPALTASRLLPLGALAAGFGLLGAPAFAQTAAPATPASAPASIDSSLKPISVKARVETDQNSLRATSTTIGKGNQALRDVPQSVTVVTEKLIEDRRIDTLKEALHQTAGISFQAAEGGEEDIRLRGFSLAASGDIYADSLRDPAFYERDTFSYDRIELLRGSASMLFGRGSTGGVVNQVSKLPFLENANQVDLTAGTGQYFRFTGDFNLKTGETAALRLNIMDTTADNYGNRIDKQGLAPTLRWGIGSDDEFVLAGYYLHNNNGIPYGLPYLRASSKQTSANPSGLIDNLDPRRYYQAASDYNRSSAELATFGHTHRFASGSGELKSAVRYGIYDRDQRAGTIRFCQRTVSAAGVVTNPTCPTALPGADNISGATRLIENGPNNKIQNMRTLYAQSDYSNKFKGWGLDHDLLTGVDLAHEMFNSDAGVLPAGVVLNKNALPITLGTDANPNAVDESQRVKLPASHFDAKALGIYAQDLIQVAPQWKLLAGLRWDYFKGDYRTYSTAASATVPVVGTQTNDYHRADSLWSKRAGALWQPNDQMSYYASYGTSFNTSGDTYQYDSQSSNTPPESSENYEIGGKFDLFSGRLTSRLAAFYSIKKNERNRDADTGAQQSLLSGKRHAAGLEFDLAGRIVPGWEVYLSYAWTPLAKIDVAAPLVTGANGMASGGTLGGEAQGQRPSLTPRHSGTVWTTYQLLPQLRIGGGLNARSSETPNRNPAGIVAPHYLTGDLLAEYAVNEGLALKVNLLNVTNKLYADSLYTAHYLPGAGRSVQLTLSARF